MSEKRHKQIRHYARTNTIGLSDKETEKEIKRMKREFRDSRHPQQGCPKRTGYPFARGRAA